MSAKVDGKCTVFVGTSSGDSDLGSAITKWVRQLSTHHGSLHGRDTILLYNIYRYIYIHAHTFAPLRLTLPRIGFLCRNDAATAKRLVRKCTINSISIFNSNYWLRKHVAQILLARVISEKRCYVISSTVCVPLAKCVFCKCPMAAALVENPTHSV